MGAAAGPIASGASLASAGLNFVGTEMQADTARKAGQLEGEAAITAAKGTQASMEFQAARAERAADFGRLQASLTSATMAENLNSTLEGIDVVRAAAGIDPSSPTTMAVEDWQRQVSNRQRNAALVTIGGQVAEDEAGASYLRQAGAYALLQGTQKAQIADWEGRSKGDILDVKAYAGLAGSFAKAFTA